MLYYRVKPDKDNKPQYKRLRNGKLVLDGIYIANELYTETEWHTHCKTHVLTAGITEPVQINSKETYWFFGARFKGGNNHV